mgnify:CR=1 FL=1
MSDFEALTEGLLINNNVNSTSAVQEKEIYNSPAIEQQQQHNKKLVLFDTQGFQNELKQKSIIKNKSYHLASENITALIK